MSIPLSIQINSAAGLDISSAFTIACLDGDLSREVAKTHAAGRNANGVIEWNTTAGKEIPINQLADPQNMPKQIAFIVYENKVPMVEVGRNQVDVQFLWMHGQVAGNFPISGTNGTISLVVKVSQTAAVQGAVTAAPPSVTMGAPNVPGLGNALISHISRTFAPNLNQSATGTQNQAQPQHQQKRSVKVPGWVQKARHFLPLIKCLAVCLSCGTCFCDCDCGLGECLDQIQLDENMQSLSDIASVIPGVNVTLPLDGQLADMQQAQISAPVQGDGFLVEPQASTDCYGGAAYVETVQQPAVNFVQPPSMGEMLEDAGDAVGDAAEDAAEDVIEKIGKNQKRMKEQKNSQQQPTPATQVTTASQSPTISDSNQEAMPQAA